MYCRGGTLVFIAWLEPLARVTLYLAGKYSGGLFWGRVVSHMWALSCRSNKHENDRPQRKEQDTPANDPDSMGKETQKGPPHGTLGPYARQ